MADLKLIHNFCGRFDELRLFEADLKLIRYFGGRFHALSIDLKLIH